MSMWEEEEAVLCRDLRGQVGERNRNNGVELSVMIQLKQNEGVRGVEQGPA